MMRLSHPLLWVWVCGPPPAPTPVMSLTLPPLASVFQEFVRKYQSTLEQTVGSGRSILPKPSPPTSLHSTHGGSPHKDPPPVSSPQDDVFSPEEFVQSLFPSQSHTGTSGNGSHCGSGLGRAVSGTETSTSIPVGKDLALTSSLMEDKLPLATTSSSAVIPPSTTAGKIPLKQR